AVAGPRDHDVVEPRVGHEPKLLEQRTRAVVMQVDTLHEQRPAARANGRQRRTSERPVRERPARAPLTDEPRLDVLAAGQNEQFGAGQRRGRALERPANEQRLPLPVPPHELFGREAPEQLRWTPHILLDPAGGFGYKRFRRTVTSLRALRTGAQCGGNGCRAT